MNRVAAIDIGTNSTRLLVAEGSGKGLKTLESRLATTRLGDGIGGGVLLPEAIKRTVDAVGGFYQIAAGMGAQQVVIAATSAVRDASNKSEFLDAVKQKTGLPVQVLSGEEEAELSYRGVLSGLPVEPCCTAVVDVGGGSTELIWKQNKRLRLASVDVGAVRMSAAGLDEEEITARLSPVMEEIKRSKVECLVGVGGTVTTLAAVDQGLLVYDPELVHGYCLTAGKVDSIFTMLNQMSVDERRQVPGLQPERADIIVAGVAIVKIIMSGAGLERLFVSEYDMLYGLALGEVEIK